MPYLFKYMMFLTRKSTNSHLTIEVMASNTIEALKKIEELYPGWTASDKMRIVG